MLLNCTRIVSLSDAMQLPAIICFEFPIVLYSYAATRDLSCYISANVFTSINYAEIISFDCRKINLRSGEEVEESSKQENQASIMFD